MPNPAGIALPVPVRTDEGMPSHGLDTALRTQHAVTAIRGPRYPAPDTITARRAAAREAEGTRVVPIRPQPQPVRDGARRHGAIVPLDGQYRASLGKPLTAMGWTRATPLAAVLRDGHAVVSVRDGGGSPATVTLTVDADKRLQLPPTIVASLALSGGDQVVAIALPDEGELHLHAATDVLQQLTGPLQPPASPSKPEATAPPVTGTRRTRIRRAWTPA
jgi:hypothetical protein